MFHLRRLFFLAAILIFCEAHYLNPNGINTELSGPQKTQGQPWPMPQVYKPTPNLVSLDILNFQFINVGVDCELLVDAYKRYSKILFGSVRKSK